MLADFNPERPGRRFIKRALYSGLALRNAILIMFGKQQPNLSFKVLSDPPSIYINFVIRADRREAFAEYINLAKGFTPTPIRCLEGEEPEFLLTLNIYEVVGVVRGLRAEWSTYVNDSEGVPRYMVLEARAREGSMDSVNLFTKPDVMEHAISDGHIRSQVTSRDGGIFESALRIDDGHPHAAIAPEWITANDFIYWRNGVCDQTFYDTRMFNASARIIDRSNISITDKTHWAEFVDPEPRHVLQYENELEFMIIPWENV